jgi:hypothetical protein
LRAILENFLISFRDVDILKEKCAVKVNVNFALKKGREGTDREQRYSSTLSLTSEFFGGCG